MMKARGRARVRMGREGRKPQKSINILIKEA
jgi:hypothetical protein